MASAFLPLLSIGAAAGIVLLSDVQPAFSAATATADLARAPVSARPVDQQRSRNPKTIDRAADGLFYAEALVGGQPVRFVIDTGATVTVLSPADAARVGAEADPRLDGGAMETAAGSTAMEWSKPTEIRVAGHAMPAVQAALPGGNIRVSLLGQDVLSRLDSLSLRGDRLTLE